MADSLTILQQDHKLATVLNRIPLRMPTLNDDVYFVLLKSIVEQQLSTKAAATIWARFLDLFEEYPHAEDIMQLPAERMREVGLSFQKAGYLKNIAEFNQSGDLDRQVIQNLSDEDAVKHLTQIKGVGKWTAEMILMFSLGRPDVFPVDDLIIRNAMIHLYDVKSEKKQLYRDLEGISCNWKPWRSHACFVLWDYYEGEVLGRPLYGA